MTAVKRGCTYVRRELRKRQLKRIKSQYSPYDHYQQYLFLAEASTADGVCSVRCFDFRLQNVARHIAKRKANIALVNCVKTFLYLIHFQKPLMFPENSVAGNWLLILNSPLLTVLSLKTVKSLTSVAIAITMQAFGSCRVLLAKKQIFTIFNKPQCHMKVDLTNGCAMKSVLYIPSGDSRARFQNPSRFRQTRQQSAEQYSERSLALFLSPEVQLDAFSASCQVFGEKFAAFFSHQRIIWSGLPSLDCAFTIPSTRAAKSQSEAEDDEWLKASFIT